MEEFEYCDVDVPVGLPPLATVAEASVTLRREKRTCKPLTKVRQWQKETLSQ